MDDNTEVNMDTDVSSTTADVPEIEEVTDSNSQVETLYVVEHLDEGTENEMSSAITKDSQQIACENEVESCVLSSPNDEVSTNDFNVIEIQKTPTEVVESNNLSPITEKTPSDPVQAQKIHDQVTTTKSSPIKVAQVQYDLKTMQCDKLLDSSKRVSHVDTVANIEETPGIPEIANEKKSPIKKLEMEEIQTTFIEISKVSNVTNAVKKDEAKEDLCERSNDSQADYTDVSEKENGKSISRELKSLMKSAKESKIISECTQLTSKTRKSRSGLDSSSSINSASPSVESEQVHTRRNSNNSQLSSSSGQSERTNVKRSMRSQNPEFVTKVKLFLNSVTGKHQKPDSDDEGTEESKKCRSETSPSAKKKKQNEHQPEALRVMDGKLRSDPYCWRCHWLVELNTNEKGHSPMQCTVCPRSYHYKCLTVAERNKIDMEKSWVCPECLCILHAENSETRSPAMKKITLGVLCELLQYALQRMMEVNGVEPFINPVDRASFPDYDKYVVHPMDLTLMKENVAVGVYGSTEAFTADVQWILHNSIIFNAVQSKLTGGARALIRACRSEMGEIEACPECYAAAHARKPTWFIDVCSTPHILLWAKLKGFPFWPAKGMSVNSSGLVDVRFFGAHDRAWVPARDCFLYSEKDPNSFRTKRQDIIDSMQEAENHIRNISRKYGKFVYPPFKTVFDPHMLNEHLKSMIPSFEGEIVKSCNYKERASTSVIVTPKNKRRSESKSSKSSNQGDNSESEENQIVTSRKMADGVEIALEEDDFTIEKDNTEVVTVPKKAETRKRRRSCLEEAVITIMENSSTAKRRRVENEGQNENLDTSIIKSKSDDKETSVNKSKIDNKETSLNKSKTVNKDTSKKDAKSKKVVTPSISKEIKEVPSSTITKEPAAEPTKPPIKTVIQLRASKTSPLKAKVNKVLSPKQKAASPRNVNLPEGIIIRTVKHKTEKRTSSKPSSPSISQTGDKTVERKNSEKRDIEVTPSQDRSLLIRNKETEADKNNAGKSKEEDSKSSKKSKDIDDNASTSLISQDESNGLPTISSVRSLSSLLQSPNQKMSSNVNPKTSSNSSLKTTSNASPKTTSNANPKTTSNVSLKTTSNANPKMTTTSKIIEITIDTKSDTSIIPTDNVRNTKEDGINLGKLRSDKQQSAFGRVGVRAFARMTSPEKPKDNIEVIIKPEPVDFDDADRQSEKMDLMNAFCLRPVNPPHVPKLRDVRINKVVSGPPAAQSTSIKTAPKPAESRPRARKTFPQPRKPDEARSELNGKNSMVYIPIQPPATQAPVRPVRPVGVNVGNTVLRPPMPTATTTGNMNNVTVTTTLHPPTPAPGASSPSNPTTTPTPSAGASKNNMPVGQLPTVHTVPYITSVNGQCYFSLQPIMSVGGVDNPQSGAVGDVAAATPVLAGSTSLPMLQAPIVTPTINGVDDCDKVAQETQPNPMPRLQQRPGYLNPLDPNAPSILPTQSSAGHTTAKLNQYAARMTAFFRNLIEDTIEKWDDPSAQMTALKMQLETIKWRSQHEIKEMKHNYDLTISEMRSSFEKDKARAVADAWRSAHAEMEAAIKVAKSKQWCANCSQEALYYCCWNTSYCDFPCQKAHWKQHFAVCAQERDQDNSNGSTSVDKSQQSAPENVPALQKNTAATTITLGGKNAPQRVTTITKEQPSGKSSIIVSMVEDKSGTPTLKCVGTYKAGGSQMSPLILNNQLMNSDEGNGQKKVVTSGGYLIVGTGGSAPLVTPRRTQTIQYYQ